MSDLNSGSGTLTAPKSGFREIHVIGAMLAAAILFAGLLSAPFSGKFLRERQIKATQQSVIVDLKLISDAEAAFFAKHHGFTTDLYALGITPKKVMYKFGFITPSDKLIWNDPQHDPSRKDLDVLKAAWKTLATEDVPAPEIGYSELTQLNKINFDDLKRFCSDCTATTTGFRAIAAANLQGGLEGDGALDVWTVDEKGNVIHVSDDLASKAN